MSDNTCHGCTHRQRRFRATTPRYWCKFYHQPASARCIDFKRERNLIESAIRFYKAAVPK